MILVISSPRDEHAKAVLRDLAGLGGAATLLDLSLFPQQMQLAMRFDGVHSRSFYLRLADQTELPLADCRVIWWRRPQPFTLHPEIQEDSHCAFAYSECFEAFSGLWQALDAFWVNHPNHDEVAARKAHQLGIAQEVGLTIPTTLITNDPDRARDFIAAQGYEKTVYKAFSATEQEWRETRLLRQDELALIDSVCYAPVIFQEYIAAEFDLRVTVVGEEIFAAAIHSQETSYKVDYRMTMADARFEVFRLPPEVEQRLHALMAKLGLVYGAIDMRMAPDGRYVFLEINPSGQWLFIEERTDQPITASFAHLLAAHDRSCHQPADD